MNLYQSISTPASDGSGNVYIIPNKEKFLAVQTNSKGVVKAELLDSEQLYQTQGDCLYFDLGDSFNLLPKLSNEMINEKSLIDFMNWNENRKVYQQHIQAKNVNVLFQTSSVPDFAVSHAIPSVSKHHFTEMMLSTSRDNGVHAVVYASRLFTVVVLDGKIILCNSYQVNTDEEILYYLLLLFQELGLSQEETAIYFRGAFPENPSETENYLGNYIRNVQVDRFEVADSNYQGVLQIIKEYHENH